MNMKEQEDRMLRKLKEMNITRDVYYHLKIEKTDIGVKYLPWDMTIGTHHITIIGETFIKLFRDNQYIGLGIARCSVLEKTFNKRKGRVIATRRAIKNYEEVQTMSKIFAICNKCDKATTIYKCDQCGATRIDVVITVEYNYGSENEDNDLHFCSDKCFEAWKIMDKE